jgi:hypothetical protein
VSSFGSAQFVDVALRALRTVEAVMSIAFEHMSVSDVCAANDVGPVCFDELDNLEACFVRAQILSWISMFEFCKYW